MMSDQDTSEGPVGGGPPPDGASSAGPSSHGPSPSTRDRIRTQAQRISDEVEATPIVGDVYDWLRAIALGVRDTAEDMLTEGRKGAKAAEGEAWRRFDNKTKFRRNK